MDFTFTEEQEMIRESVRDFAQSKIAPIALEMEKTKKIPLDVIKGMAELGLLACTADEKYGGSGLDAVTTGIIGQELARGDPTGSIPVFWLVQASWGYLLNKYGTEQAKKEIFPKVCSGEWFLGIATTESDAGSDVNGTRTMIKKVDDGFIVSGEKMYISGTREAHEGGGGHLTIAHQDLEKGARGMTMFYLPLTDKGITPQYLDDMGREGISCGGFSIDDVKIPAHYIIGEEMKGFYYVHEGYEYARGLIAAICAAAGDKSLENGMAYIKERKCFGTAIGKFEEVNFRLAEHHTRMHMLHNMAFESLLSIDLEQQGKATRFETAKKIAMAKMFCSDWACAAANDVMQWQGAFGYTHECQDNAIYRAVRSFAWAEGTKEIMKMIVARELLGKDFVAYK